MQLHHRSRGFNAAYWPEEESRCVTKDHHNTTKEHLNTAALCKYMQDYTTKSTPCDADECKW
jgi:hypothetical protein